MVAKLESGVYTPGAQKKVTVWGRPDVNGDGDVLMIEEKDHNGESLGTNVARDPSGNEIHRYLPPEGFRNVMSHDGADNWVRVDGQGRVVRNPAGQAIPIKEGVALVEYPDGSWEHLTGDLAHYQFAQSHVKFSEV